MIEEIAIDNLKANLQPIQPDDSMAEAGRKVLLENFIVLMEHEAGCREKGDIEDIHQMRVATRQMRSLLRLLEPYFKSKPIRPFQERLKLLASALGRVRDLDVMLEDTQKHQAKLKTEAEREALQATVDYFTRRRDKAYRKLIEMMETRSHYLFLLAFQMFLTQPGKGSKALPEREVLPYQVRHALPSLIHDHLGRVRAYESVLAEADIETLHALRIEFKRLRYVLTYFKSVLGSPVEKYIDEIKLMQDYLGRMNDASAAKARLVEMLADGDFNEAQRQAVAQYVEKLDRHVAESVAACPAAWEKFNKRTIQKYLSDSLLALR